MRGGYRPCCSHDRAEIAHARGGELQREGQPCRGAGLGEDRVRGGTSAGEDPTDTRAPRMGLRSRPGLRKPCGKGVPRKRKKELRRPSAQLPLSGTQAAEGSTRAARGAQAPKGGARGTVSKRPLAATVSRRGPTRRQCGGDCLALGCGWCAAVVFPAERDCGNRTPFASWA